MYKRQTLKTVISVLLLTFSGFVLDLSASSTYENSCNMEDFACTVKFSDDSIIVSAETCAAAQAGFRAAACAAGHDFFC